MIRYLVLGLIGCWLLGCDGSIGGVESGVARGADPEGSFGPDVPGGDLGLDDGVPLDDNALAPLYPEPMLPTPDPLNVPEATPPPPMEPAPSPAPEAAPSPAPEAAPSPAPEAAPSPAPEAAPSPAPEAAPSPAPEPAPSPLPEPTPVPEPTPPPGDLSGVPTDVLIKASRDGCTSPCGVFFDAIADLSWGEIESSKFTWVFSDGATVDGFMAARVFELFEGQTEKTIQVTLVVEQDGVLVAQDTHTVTVRPLAGRTICVAQSDFSGCPSSDSADHFTNARDGWDAIETNGRILFRRGDAFAAMDLSSTVSGPVQVGAFGDLGAPRPSLTQSGGSVDLDSEWSFTDLDISGGGMSTNLFGIGGDHTLILRNHLHDMEDAFVSNGDGYDFSTHKFIMHNVVTDTVGTNYIAGNYIAIIGNHMERWGSDRHTIRIAGGKHVLVTHNTLISDVGHSSLTVRGSSKRPGSDYVLAQGNVLMQWASVHPQNDTSNEWLRHVIWERNVHIPHPGQATVRNGLSVNGDDMVIRNNIFHQIRRAIIIETHPLAGVSNNIHVYQNTHFVDEDRDSTHSFCAASSSNTGVVVQSNLALIYGRSTSSEFVSVGGNAVVENNYGYAPSVTELCERPDGSSACTDPNLANTTDPSSPDFMLPQAGSLVIDAALDVPASNDFHGTPRPQGGSPDIGAVERPQ